MPASPCIWTLPRMTCFLAGASFHLSRCGVSIKLCLLAGASIEQTCWSPGFSLRIAILVWPQEHHWVMCCELLSLQLDDSPELSIYGEMFQGLNPWRMVWEGEKSQKEHRLSSEASTGSASVEMRWTVPSWLQWSNSTQGLSFFLLYPVSVLKQNSCSAPSSLPI